MQNRLPIPPAPFPMNKEGGARKSDTRPSLFIGRGKGWVTLSIKAAASCGELDPVSLMVVSNEINI